MSCQKVVEILSDNDDGASKTAVLDEKKKLLLKQALLARMRELRSSSDDDSSDEENQNEGMLCLSSEMFEIFMKTPQKWQKMGNIVNSPQMIFNLSY